MKKCIRSKLQAQTLVEFALLLPVFLLFVIVVFDLGRAVYYYSAVHNAAREGARYGIIHPNDAPGMQSTAVNYAIGLGLADTDVSAGLGTPEIIDGFPNPTVKVTVVYCFTPATPLVDRLLPNDPFCGGQMLRLTSEAVMRTETMPSP